VALSLLVACGPIAAPEPDGGRPTHPAAAGDVAGTSAAGHEGPPNILVIVTDDQRTPFTGMPRTEHWFGRRGLTFGNAFATTPLCCPSRASIMTGRYAHNHGVLNNALAPNLDESTTVQRYLHDAGYRTALVGKYLNRWPLGRPPAHFDRYAMFDRGYYDTDWSLDGVPTRARKYSTTFVGDVAIRYLRSFEVRDDSDPWFLLVTPYAPHRPATAAPGIEAAPVAEWRRSPAVRERNRTDKPPWVFARKIRPARSSRVRGRQLRSLLSADQLVERLMLALRAFGERRDTLAFFLSDNGTFWGEHGLWGKRMPYAEAVRVPLLVRWPGHVRAGSTTDRLVANIDVAPTALQAAGIAPHFLVPSLDGRPLLTGRPRSELLLEYWVDPGKTGDVPPWSSLWTPVRQYIEYYGEDGTTPVFRELYKLRHDPWQLRNVLADHSPANDPDTSSLQLSLATLRTCAGTSGPSACP